MLGVEYILQLKQSNISADGDKTKERVEKLWKAAAAEQKEAVLAQADVVAATIYRVYRTGCISAKLAVPLAQTLNVNPFYLTGQDDDPGEYSDSQLRKLLMNHGYELIVKAANLKRPYERKQPPAEETPAITETVVEVEPEATALLLPQLPPNSDSLDPDDLRLLLDALNIRAKAGISEAKEKLAQIRVLLLA